MRSPRLPFDRSQNLSLAALGEMLLSIVLSAAASIGALWLLRGVSGMSTEPEYAALVVGTVAGWLLAVFTHGLGHALAALLVGRRIYVFAIGPVALRRLNDGRYRFRRWRMGRRAMGMVVAVGEQASHTRLRDLLYLAAGPFTNLVLGGAALCFVLLGGADEVVKLAVYPFAAISLYLGVINLWPAALTNMYQRDGRQIVQTLKGDVTPRGRALLDVARLCLASIRPREWPADVVTALDAGPEDPSTESLLADWYRHEIALDRGDIPEADRWMTRLLERFDSLDQAWIDLLAPTLMYFIALHRRDAKAAGRVFEKQKGSSATSLAFDFAAQAAIALASGAPAIASALADKAIARCRRDAAVLSPDVLDRCLAVKAAADAAAKALYADVSSEAAPTS